VTDTAEGQLRDLDEWEEDLRRRYPEPEGTPVSASENDFRGYGDDTRAGVREFYLLNHTHQTLAFAQAKRAEYSSLDHRRMGIWEAMDFLNTLVDDSDPDTELPQIEHLLQTAEAIRHDGHPRWFVLAGLIHDLGKILCLFGEPQWAVVGDTFPLGCSFSSKIAYSDFFADNPDSKVSEYQTPLGIYEEGCGLDQVCMSWGHDEYLYGVVKDYLPSEALHMIRYHSCYPIHREGEYAYLMSDEDRKMFRWVRAFNAYDLYTKRDTRPDVAGLRSWYEELIAEFLPPELAW